MVTTFPGRSRRTSKIFTHSVALAFILAIAATAIKAQDPTPSGMAPGGGSSYDFINYFNGNHSFQLPLLPVSGRGAMQVPVLLQIQQNWHATEYFDQNGFPIYNPSNDWWSGYRLIYEPGYMYVRQQDIPAGSACDSEAGPETGPWYNIQTNSNLIFTGADGTEHLFIDQLTHNKPSPISSNYCYSPPVYSRGKVFISTDGSGATFIADDVLYDNIYAFQESIGGVAGTMLLKDGTQYKTNYNGSIIWMRDRNGNQINFGYEIDPVAAQYNPSQPLSNRLASITDSLNRQITF